MAAMWWGSRPRALELARRAGVDADVEAAIRNHARITRTLLYALRFTIVLTVINSVVIERTLDLQATWSAFALAMSQVVASSSYLLRGPAQAAAIRRVR